MAPVRLPKQEPTRRSERVQLAEAVQVSKVEVEAVLTYRC